MSYCLSLGRSRHHSKEEAQCSEHVSAHRKKGVADGALALYVEPDLERRLVPG